MPAANPRKTKSALNAIKNWFDSAKLLVLAFVLAAPLVIGFGLINLSDHKAVVINGQTICVEVVRSNQDKTKGLSGREELAEDAGMLFVYGQAGEYGFWMRDMNFAIDIIWIDSDRRVVDITSDVDPDTYPEVFRSDEPAQYILEVNAGYARQHNIEVGQNVKLPL